MERNSLINYIFIIIEALIIKMSNNILESKSFEPLFATDKNGKTKEWTIRVDKHTNYSKIVYSYGYTDGKKTQYELEITKGKNIGKKNETTHFQQAL